MPYNARHCRHYHGHLCQQGSHWLMFYISWSVLNIRPLFAEIQSWILSIVLGTKKQTTFLRRQPYTQVVWVLPVCIMLKYGNNPIFITPEYSAAIYWQVLFSTLRISALACGIWCLSCNARSKKHRCYSGVFLSSDFLPGWLSYPQQPRLRMGYHLQPFWAVKICTFGSYWWLSQQYCSIFWLSSFSGPWKQKNQMSADISEHLVLPAVTQ